MKKCYIRKENEKGYKNIYMSHYFIQALSWNVGFYQGEGRNKFLYYVASMSVIKNQQKHLHSKAREWKEFLTIFSKINC